MKCLFICLSLSFSSKIVAQLYLNGADFIITTTALVYVNEDSLIVDNNAQFLQNGFLRVDKDLINQNGTLVNDGDIYVYNDIIINDEAEGLSNASNFYITGNWINNNLFIPGLSTVTLNGNLQEISGTEVSSFYNLTTLGALSAKKTLVNTNASVSNIFNLGDSEFATEGNTLSILNPTVSSIQRSTGFVSSLDTGRLERITNSTNVYLFPTGSTLGPTRYRPIALTPTTNASTTFGARLANLNASVDNFDVLQLSDSLCSVNPNFYHRIYAQLGSADISMFYIPSEDGDWNHVANWNATDIWGETSVNNSNTLGVFSSVKTFNVSDFTESAFALAIEKPTLVLDNQIEILNGQSATISPNYTGINPINIVWTPMENNNCPNCLETELSPSTTTLYYIAINATQTCAIADSILVIVKPLSLQFPTAFSPNFDGVNDYFISLNQNIEYFDMSIFNRWGELIFKSGDVTVGWDGTYKEKAAEIGVYSYHVEYKNIGNERIEKGSGNITLIR